MFEKLLIANRGEIASRVIRTCKKMGIRSVAVYSEADQDAPFVKEADEAYLLGGARVQESYLNIEKIIEIANLHHCQAIHPGYGFLSENAGFARKCKENGIVFIGPTPEIMELMGKKIEAREAMDKAGLPILPGTPFPLKDAIEAVLEAEKIGYPVMLKASAGGGGIGMQIARDKEELVKAFEGNQKRAQMFFGDGAMFIEKYIEQPRHIEIQVLSDKNSETVYLWERECSIQRRHQKVVEEAPSVFLDDEVRKQMGESAVQAAKAIGYQNAGTFEFLVDEQKQFYFLEMNTRLQVEHPVTEEITGLDLVEEQIRIAYGEPLRYAQKDIQRKGHAIEVRIYAEDPITFYPSPGKITELSLPVDARHELSVHGSSTISPFYDPMIAKLIVHGNDRKEAIQKLNVALSEYKISGIKTNIPMLQQVINHDKFFSGETTTSFIPKYYSNSVTTK